MNRWYLKIEYDGRNYVGWQRQDNGPSIQQSLEKRSGNFQMRALEYRGPAGQMPEFTPWVRRLTLIYKKTFLLILFEMQLMPI